MKKLNIIRLQSNTLLLWVIFIIFNSVAFAQIKSQKFTHFGKEDGLNQSSVNFIFQDSNDFVWIANFGGINKFDGYDFSSYANEFGNDSSISDNSVWAILERKQKDLCFGTKRGLSKYNDEKDNFKNYFISGDNPSSGTLSVKALFVDKNGRFYVGSEGEGLCLFSEKEEKFSLVTAILQNAKMNAITEDVWGNLWVGTWGGGLNKFDKDIIERVLVNLLTNAIKFSRSDKNIEIFAKEDPQNINELVLCVKDYGIGIPKDKIVTIFNIVFAGRNARFWKNSFYRPWFYIV